MPINYSGLNATCTRSSSVSFVYLTSRKTAGIAAHSPGYLPTLWPGTTVRPESKSRIRILQASRRPGSIRDAQREPAEEGTGAYRKMQTSIILQGRSVHRARRVLRGEALHGGSNRVSLSLSLSPSLFCSFFCFLLPSSSSFSLLLALAAGQPTYVEMLRCKTVDCHGAVFSLCTAMVAVGVPGTTEGRRPRPPHRALPRLCLLYFGTRV